MRAMNESNSLHPDGVPFFPFPSGPQPRDVSHQLVIDGLSRPRISTILRRRALSHDEVRRVVLYHTGVQYSTAVLVEKPTVEKMREINCELIALASKLFPVESSPETYVVGTDFSAAPMFHRFGRITVIDKDVEQFSRSAA